MSLQGRMTANDPRYYNPNRDVAHNFVDIMSRVSARLEDNQWPELGEILEREAVTIDDLGEACAAYCTFMGTAPAEGDNQVTMAESLRNAGFFACKPGAQVAIMAMLGTVYAGVAYQGIREATIGDSGPLKDIHALLDSAEELRKYIYMPTWKRKLVRLKLKLVKVLSAFKG